MRIDKYALTIKLGYSYRFLFNEISLNDHYFVIVNLWLHWFIDKYLCPIVYLLRIDNIMFSSYYLYNII